METDGKIERSSRIYVHGLPAYLDEQRLREVFAERGEVTDTKIIRTADGRSRQFGFVGFRDESQAAEAISYFNNSYIDTSRISIKFAERSDSSRLGRPWSKHSKGSSAHIKRERQKNGKTSADDGRPAKKQKASSGKHPKDAEVDSELEEFLQVMQPRRKTALWADDGGLPAAESKQASQKAASKRKAAQSDSDEDAEYQDLPSNEHQKNAAGKSKGQTGKRSESSVLPGADDSQTAKKKRKGKKAEKARQAAAEASNSDKPDDSEAPVEDGISDMEYLIRRTKASGFDEDKDEEEDKNAEEAESEIEEEAEEEEEAADFDKSSNEKDAEQLTLRKSSHQKAAASGKEADETSVEHTGRLFLRNLTYSATESDILALFEEYGDLAEVHLVVDRNTQKSKGFALVQFSNPEDAAAAMAALDGSIFQGRLLHILPAQPPRTKLPTTSEVNDAAAGQINGTGKSFANIREAQQKENAGNRSAWNPLFMRADTVAEAIAAHFGVSKAQLLNRDAADLPVRMALGEAHVIAMTKAGLAKSGVAVEALENAAASSGGANQLGLGVERSERVLLVKNLPYSTSTAELEESFGKFGSITRLALPDTKTIALVEFAAAADARKAFKALAYRKFQNVPLFLEWAPKDIFKAPTDQDLAQAANSEEQTGRGETESAAVDAAELRGGEGEDDVESSSLFVKNLAWATTDAALLRHFDSAVSAAGGSIRAVNVARKQAAEGASLSAGYGFVECSSEAVAKLVMRKLQGTSLDGHKLAIQLSIRKAATNSTKQKKQPKEEAAKQTKVVVRNIAFEASSKEVRALFQPFGQVKSVRLPRKFDNSHRGFAFVDFLSHQEAVNAMEGVAGTHLYGRRLVVEWAEKSDADLDKLRAKTAAKFEHSEEAQLPSEPAPEAPSRKRKK